ncbi:HD domain-containing protein [Tengunoibacter tsumagoiensis]|uniref:HD-CE domain-containing protein n=1 Tax=Tengunoibacter tsumagoiensis TaxID=2014871 RepID=A0A402A5T4_9CHLR|nr:hypothetical protein [Tengunoibacter tsumagoiensis]GCE14507.1 hypothetical protein KTT_43660 [Tengunoibacter tsumagoiensis]
MNTGNGSKGNDGMDINPILKNRLDAIAYAIPKFWEQRIYTHFTNHGYEHSERVLNQKIAQLAQELPLERRLIEDEIFILSASAWLYEVGMQSPNLSPLLHFTYQPGVELTADQLLAIRAQKHKLSGQLIIDSIRTDYDGPPLSFGLPRSGDDYIRAIIEVCQWCSNEPLEHVPTTMPVKGIEVRLRLMVALLRLADQLYIDSSRVNIDQLKAFHLPPEEEARWWAYHYTQTLPIDRGKIRFYYSLPDAQKQYLGHIRALIEPQFEYAQNPTIRYLYDEYDIRLIVQQHPQVRLDLQEGFVKDIPPQIQNFLRNTITPIQPDKGNGKPSTSKHELTAERLPLLILDYENLVLQLGFDGSFPSLEELKQLIAELTSKARDEFNEPPSGWMIGHWDRPDMVQVREIFQQIFQYELKTLEDGRDNALWLQEELAQVLQRSNAPTQTLLVAPREEWNGVARPFWERRQSLTVWLYGPPTRSLFRMSIRNIKSLDELDLLPEVHRVSPETLEALQDLCLLKLEDELQKRKSETVKITAVAPLLNELRELDGHGEWWKLKVLSEGLIVSDVTPDEYVVRIDASREVVNQLHTARSTVIKAMQVLMNGQQMVLKEDLLRYLAPLPVFKGKLPTFKGKEAESFCLSLQRVGILQMVPRDNRSWRLNGNNPFVLAEGAEQSLPLFVLGIDHFLAREGYFQIHKHILVPRLTNYIAQDTTMALYELALEKGLIYNRVLQKKLRGSNEALVDVMLSYTHEEVRTILHHRNLLLLRLYKAPKSGLTADDLWLNVQKPHNGRRFTFTRETFQLWLNVWQRDGLLTRQSPTTGSVLYQLNIESPLAISLLGRLNILNLIRTMRIMGCTKQSKPAQEVVERLHKYDTRNLQLAQFTLHYAQKAKIVVGSKQVVEEKTVEYVMLNAKSDFLYLLDARNTAVCTSLRQLVESLSSRYPDGLVPEHKLLQEMQKESQFGLVDEEHRYWINQTIHQQKLLLEHSGDKSGRGRGQKSYSVNSVAQERKKNE